MRFASLGSGSRGNATLINVASSYMLLDCGFSEKETRRRLARFDLQPSDLDAIVVTHEHGDHISGVGVVARKHEIPVYMTHGTAALDKIGKLPSLQIFGSHDVFSVGDIELHAFPVPHDAREPVQFVFTDGNRKLGILTDTGCITQHIIDMLDECDALVLESNHDTDMLADGPYPASLKDRVGGRFGHLSNTQAMELLSGIDTSRLQHVVAAHISEKNNTIALACAALAEGLVCHSHDIAVADQDDGFGWFTVS